MKYPNIPYLLALVFSLFVASSAQAKRLPFTPVSSIAAGYAHTCAATTVGGVKCWGWNSYGQLGDNTTTERITPVDVVGLSSGVSAMAAAYAYTCALTTAGGVKCWGYNDDGQLGDGTTTNRLTPVAVVGLSSGVSAIAADAAHTCALTTVGGVKCWGNNYYGELGDNTTTNRSTPVDVVGLSSGVSAITAGNAHTCAVTTTGAVKCWGDNQYGQLGDSTTTQRLTPVAVVGLSSGVSAIAAGGSNGENHTCVLTTSGGVKCWGDNLDGDLGDGTNTQRLTPVAVVSLSSGVSAIAASNAHTCALTTAGGVKCWGANFAGQLGDNQASGTESFIPVSVVGLSSGVSAIAAGDSAYTCAVMATGSVQCWGENGYGELGDGTTTWRYTPVDVFWLSVTSSVKNDFDGDGKSDVLFLNSTSGGTQYWKAAARAQAIYPGTYDTSYTYAGSGDFNGDGKADLFFTRASNNGTLIWSGAVKTAASYPGVSVAGFTVAAICDVDGDGLDDVVWFNATTGGTQIWPAATKASVTYPGTQNTAYTVVACGDFDGDGKADLFWRNATTGADEIWLSANKSTKLYPGLLPDPSWSVIGAGDTNGDGKADLVWYQAQNPLDSSIGSIAIWLGGMKTQAIYPGSNGNALTPVAIGDYNGDGDADLLWINSSTHGIEIWSGVRKGESYESYPGLYPAGFSVQK